MDMRRRDGREDSMTRRKSMGAEQNMQEVASRESGGSARKREQELRARMVAYYRGDPARIQHFMKVYAFAAMEAEEEGVPEETMEILRAAALVHDIGIKAAEEKYGSSNGKLQEKEGPAIAETMLAQVGYPEHIIRRVSYLVGHHHTYTDIDGIDYQILVEADFLVNLFEDGISRRAVRSTEAKIFRTRAGKRILQEMYALDESEA